MKKKLLAFLLAALMLVSLLPVTAFADTVTGLSGSGTEASPYLIGNLAELEYMADKVSNSGNVYINSGDPGLARSSHYKLTADIGSETVPFTRVIGNTSSKFNGTFDGAGHTVWLNINTSATYVGFFNCVDSATIENLTVAGSVVNSSSGSAVCTGGIVGRLEGSTVINNCVNKAAITGGSNIAYTGGIAGHTGDSSLNNAYVIMNCGNTAAISRSGSESAFNVLGGIVGYAGSDAGIIENCYNTGAVTCKNTSGGAGGIAGCHTGMMKNCYNMGAVLNEDTHYTGGLFAYVNGGNHTGTAKHCRYSSAASQIGAKGSGSTIVQEDVETMDETFAKAAAGTGVDSSLVDFLNGYKEGEDPGAWPEGWIEWEVATGEYPKLKAAATPEPVPGSSTVIDEVNVSLSFDFEEKTMTFTPAADEAEMYRVQDEFCVYCFDKNNSLKYIYHGPSDGGEGQWLDSTEESIEENTIDLDSLGFLVYECYLISKDVYTFKTEGLSVKVNNVVLDEAEVDEDDYPISSGYLNPDTSRVDKSENLYIYIREDLSSEPAGGEINEIKLETIDFNTLVGKKFGDVWDKIFTNVKGNGTDLTVGKVFMENQENSKTLEDSDEIEAGTYALYSVIAAPTGGSFAFLGASDSIPVSLFSGTINGEDNPAITITATIMAVALNKGEFNDPMEMQSSMAKSGDTATHLALMYMVTLEESFNFTHSLVMDSELGLRFHMNESALGGEIGKVEVQFANAQKTGGVCKKEYTSFSTDTDGNKVVIFDVNSAQFSEPVLCTVYGTDMTTVLGTDTYSVDQYYASARKAGLEADAIVGETINNYGHFAQNYLSAVNGWTILEGDNYGNTGYHKTKKTKELLENLDSEIRAAAVLELTRPGTETNGFSVKLILESQTAIQITLDKTPSGNITVTKQGGAPETFAPARYITISGLRPDNLTDVYTIAVDGYTLELNALGYYLLCDGTATEGLNKAELDAVTALYEYYLASTGYVTGNLMLATIDGGGTAAYKFEKYDVPTLSVKQSKGNDMLDEQATVKATVTEIYKDHSEETYMKNAGKHALYTVKSDLYPRTTTLNFEITKLELSLDNTSWISDLRYEINQGETGGTVMPETNAMFFTGGRLSIDFTWELVPGQNPEEQQEVWIIFTPTDTENLCGSVKKDVRVEKIPALQAVA